MTLDPMAQTIEAAIKFRQRLDEVRARRLPENGLPWYPYDIMANVWHLSNFLSGEDRSIFSNLNGARIADIGGADGDLGLFLASQGAEVDVIDFAPTNMNHLSGARTLSLELGIPINIISADIDSQFNLASHYDFAIFLGILYHLKNPYYVLETLARNVSKAVLSTRVAEYDKPAGSSNRTQLPGASAYFLDNRETNNDSTNYWIFNQAGLKLIAHRTGWAVSDFATFGSSPESSDPVTPEGDCRAFCLLKSRAFVA